MDIASFVRDNSTLIIIIGLIVVIILVGFVAQQTKIGKKVLFKDQKNNDKKVDLNSKDLNKPLIEKKDNIPTILSGMNEKPIKTDIFDNISSNFNENSLSIADVNENPNMSEKDLEMTEDLYATFGDAPTQELKIEDVNENTDFQIMETVKNEDGQVIAPTEEEMAKLMQPIESVTVDENNVQTIEQENPEEKTTEEKNEDNNEDKISNEYEDEINSIVDTTFVLNDATEENNEKMTLQEENNEDQDKTEDDTSEFEKTTSLKLDEINEQIRNLKLEDLDNVEEIGDEETEKKEQKKKSISIKSIDDILNEKNNSQN